MPLTHPKGPARSTKAELEHAPSIAMLEGHQVPRHSLPADELPPDAAYQIIHDELMIDGNARLNLATFVSTWMEPQAQQLMTECFDKNMIDKDEYPQTAEIEKRCVNILAELWHAPEAEPGHRVLDDRLQRGRDARRAGAQAPLAAAPRGGGQVTRQAEHRDGRQRPDLLGEVRQLLGRGDEASSRWRATASTSSAEEAVKLVDENTIGVVAILGSTFDGVVRADRRDLRGARRAAGRAGLDVPVHVDGASGAFIAPFVDEDLVVGLPAAARVLDQRVRPQVRPRLPGRRLDRLARRRRAAGGADLLGQLPRRRHADVRAQLLAPGRPGRRAVLHVPAPRLRGLQARAGLLARGRDAARRARSRSSARSS